MGIKRHHPSFEAKASPITRMGSTQSYTSSISSDPESRRLAPYPTIPGNFLAILAVARSRYFEDKPGEAQNFSGPMQRQGSESGVYGLDGGDYWTNWRERLEKELAEGEE